MSIGARPEASKGDYCILKIVVFKYRGSLPYAHFGTWKKPCYMKFMLVGLYCGPLLTLIPPFTHTKAKNRVCGNNVSDFRVSVGPPVLILYA